MKMTLVYQLEFWGTDDYKIILKLLEGKNVFWKLIYCKGVFLGTHFNAWR